MVMMKRLTTVSRFALLGLAAAVAAVAACGPPGAGSLTERLSVATGGTGGVYYPYGGATLCKTASLPFNV